MTIHLEAEVWLQIPSEPNYEASSHGCIRRAAGGPGAKKGQPLALTKCGPYLAVTTSHTGVLRNRKVHSLIAEAFHGPRPEGSVVRHLDGDSANNRPVNISYGTQQTNILEKRDHGTMRRGDSHPRSKLSDEQMLAAVADALVIGQRPASRKHGISQAVLWRVINGKLRLHMQDRIQALASGSRGSVRVVEAIA